MIPHRREEYTVSKSGFLLPLRSSCYDRSSTQNHFTANTSRPSLLLACTLRPVSRAPVNDLFLPLRPVNPI